MKALKTLFMNICTNRGKAGVMDGWNDKSFQVLLQAIKKKKSFLT
jgi:hypothetical protein